MLEELQDYSKTYKKDHNALVEITAKLINNHPAIEELQDYNKTNNDHNALVELKDYNKAYKPIVSYEVSQKERYML